MNIVYVIFIIYFFLLLMIKRKYNKKLLMKRKNLYVYLKNNNIILKEKNKNQNYFLTKYNVNTFYNYFRYCRHIIRYIETYNSKKNNILMLGFGIGGLSLKLSTYKDCDCIDNIDINYDLFDMFNQIQKYIRKYPKEKMNNYCMSAEDFIKTTTKKYDIIIDDVFNDDKILLDYKKISTLINKNGILFINIENIENYNKIKSQLLSYFSTVTYIDDEEFLVICIK